MMINEMGSLLLGLEDLEAVVRVELLVHGLELLDGHGFKSAGSALEDADLELYLAQFLLVLLLLLLLVLFLQHLQLVLLFLQALLDDLGAGDDAFLHLLHHVCFDLDCHLKGVDGLAGMQASLLEEWLEVIILVARFLALLFLVPVFLEFLPRLVVESLLDGQQAQPHLFVLLGDGALLILDDLVAFSFLGQQILVFLLDQRIVLLLTGVDLAISQNLIPGILFLDGLDLSLLHVVVNNHLFFLEVDGHLGDLFLCGLQLAPLPHLAHLQDPHLANVVVLIVFRGVFVPEFVLDEGHASVDDLVVSVLVDLGSLLSDFLDALDEAIVVPVGVIGDDPHPAVDFDHLLPVRHLARAVVFHSLELVGIAIFSL